MNDQPTRAPQEIPAGYKQDRQGNLVPKDRVKPIDLDRDRLVSRIAKKAKRISGTIADFKSQAFADIADFVDRSASQYDAKPRGVKGNMQLYTFDGQFRLDIAVNENRTFDERLQTAKSLIDECIHEWMKGSNKNIQAIVDQAFQVDQQGKVSVERILGLRKLDIDDPRWKSAMDAISDSIQITGSKKYIRLYERKPGTDEYERVPLDAANA